MQDDVVALFAYDRWANTKVFDACRKLTAEQYVAEPVSGWSSVRSTIYHIALATEFNLRTLAGDPDDRIPTEADLATVDDVAQLLERAYRRFEELRPTLTPERLNTVLTLRGRPHFHPAAVGDTAPHCQSLQLPPRSNRVQAQTVRDRTIDHGLLLVGDRADSAREVNDMGRRRPGAVSGADPAAAARVVAARPRQPARQPPADRSLPSLFRPREKQRGRESFPIDRSNPPTSSGKRLPTL